MEKTLGPDHPKLGTAYTSLAFVLGRTGNPERKLELEQRALALEESNLGLDHPNVGLTLINLGHSLLAANRFAEAQEALERAVSNLEVALGPDHVYVGSALGALGDALVHRWELDGRRPTLERFSRLTEQRVGTDDAKYAIGLLFLGVHRRFEGRDDEAETTFRQALATLEQVQPDHPFLSRILMELAIVCARRSNDDDAETYHRRALEAYGPASDDPRALYARARYAAANGDSGAALQLLQEASRGGYPMDRIEHDPDLAPFASVAGSP
jgi:serine/threonine-protein kinase